MSQKRMRLSCSNAAFLLFPKYNFNDLFLVDLNLCTLSSDDECPQKRIMSVTVVEKLYTK